MNTFCSYFNNKTCQSCRFIEVDYSIQLKDKEKRLKESLCAFEDWELLPSVESRTLGFRNKAKLVVTGTMEKPIIGLPGTQDLDQGREIINCPVHIQPINELLQKLPAFITLTKLEPYRISEKKGELKGLIIYYSEISNECYLRFVTRSRESTDRVRKHLPSLISEFPSLTCVSINIQPVAHAILEGEEEIILTEKANIRHLIDDVELRLGPKGFVQTNQLMAQKLYQTAAAWTKDLKVNKFVELFCGQGAFSFFMAPYVTSSTGFEIDPDAVNHANATVKARGIQNMNFKCADAAVVGEEVKAIKPDLLLLNPPRRGLAESISILKEKMSPYVIYSSCSLDSLAKDLEKLKPHYDIKRVQLFDMFPHTEHFETLVLLKAKA